MPRPRKRKRAASAGEFNTEGSPIWRREEKKKKKKKSGSQSLLNSPFRHPVLSHYFPHVQSLRQYITAQLPPSSKIRRKKISAVGIVSKSHDMPLSDVERSLGALLDTTVVCYSDPAAEAAPHRMNEWKEFSHRGDESYVTLSNGVAGFVESQALIVEYVVRTLFSKDRSAKWPNHLLCDGFHRNGGLGLRTVRPNRYVEMLQQPPWPQLLALLGESGDRIMIDLLLDCAIFTSIDTVTNNVCQISGRPLSSISVCRPTSTGERLLTPRKCSDLVFVRSRMFYARPALNARGLIHFGLRHIHVLNRCPLQQLEAEQGIEMQTHLNQQNGIQTLRVMMYIFPRQFGLHNVFTSEVNTKETSQRLKDYTLREDEILEKFGRLLDNGVFVKTPKRLRGPVRDLVHKLQILHQRCSYYQLMQHYCPIPFSIDEPQLQSESGKVRRHPGQSKMKKRKWVTQLRRMTYIQQKNPNSSVTALATSSTEVSSFCQAVLRKIIPQGFWGCGVAATHNELQFLMKVDRFISLRRFEGMSLHELSQGMKITSIEWLAPIQLMMNKISFTDMQKRQELFNEFLYFLFDSILIPLVRSNFYVTESSTDKYRVFFFRHDIWRSLVEPAMIILKEKTLEEISLAEANDILDSRRLGFSHIRLLPKGAQMRPITNMGQRNPTRGNPKELGLSINKILAPAHKVLQLEKVMNPSRLGSALFSVDDIYERMKTFKFRMLKLPTRFYFAKLDVRAAFDTIPQAAIVSLLNSIPQQRQYRILKYLQVSPSIVAQRLGQDKKSNPVKKWPMLAFKSGDASTPLHHLENGQNARKRNTVFVDLYQKQFETSELLQLVASHIQDNIIKVGKKYYRQKQGIPQGSILSSTLCNYFYADLETHVLSFLNSKNSLLLRLIDDFLLITTDRLEAVQLVETLHRGVLEYGVTVNPTKSLVNFDLVVDGQQVPRLEDREGFPYCGTLIDPMTLNISRASNQAESNGIYNSLTVEYSRTPGQTFERKVINAFKIQSHLMFFDTRLNSVSNMLKNLHRAFMETASKMWAYARCLPAPKQPPPKFIIKTIKKLAETAYILLAGKTRRLRYPGYFCDVKKCEVIWLAYSAFHQILSRKQANYSEILAWLEAERIKLSMSKDIRHARVQTLV